MLTLLIVLTFSAVSCSALQCWNCVGSDCDVFRAGSKNWQLVECPEGSVCQKTDFMFYSNQKNESLSSHTVRSCSYETGCTWERSRSCQKSPVQYAGRGCVDRFCCAKDKCNHVGTRTLFITFAMIFVTLMV